MSKNKSIQIRVTERRRNLKKQAINYLGGKCSICGYNKSVNALHFHHKDPTQKDFGISKSIKSWEKIKIELDKCILLCANCHAEEHEKLFKIKFDSIKILPKQNKSIEYKCDYCGITLITYKSKIDRSKHIFCGTECKKKYFTSYKWPSDNDLIKMAQTLSVDEICAKIKMGKSTVYRKLKKLTPDQKSNNINTCIFCGKFCENKYCNTECYHKNSEKIDWPDAEKLKELVWSKSILALSKEFGISDRAIKDRCVKLKIECPPIGYWAIKR
jgi:hypothetical protein